jgi:hypothetical protein
MLTARLFYWTFRMRQEWTSFQIFMFVPPPPIIGQHH